MNYARRRRSSADIYLMRTAWREAAIFLHLLLAFGGICGIAGSEFSCTTGYGYEDYVKVSSGTCDAIVEIGVCTSPSVVSGNILVLATDSTSPRGCYFTSNSVTYNSASSTTPCSSTKTCLCKDCQICPKGHYGYGNSSCAPCVAGDYNDEIGQSSCKRCPAGKFVGEGGAEDCKDCSTGKFSSAQGQTECSECSIGKYNDEVGRANPTSCKPCLAGTFNDLLGQQSCKDCVLGRFTAASDQSSCKACAEGQFQEATGSDSCKPCLAGTFNDLTGQSSCKTCGAGLFSGTDGQTRCSDCDAGQFQDVPGAVNCKECLPGTYNNIRAQLICKKCDAGKFSSLPGLALCIDCAAGKFQESTGETLCFNCPTPENCDAGGKCFSPWDGKACTKCKENYYFVDDFTCLKCPESNVGLWILCIVLVPIICISIYTLFKYEQDLDETNDSISDEKKVALRRQSMEQGKLAKLSTRKRSKNAFTQVPTSVAASVFAKHSLNLSFLMPVLRLIYIPEDLRVALRAFLSAVTIDLSGT